MNERKEDGSTLCEFRMGRKSVHENHPEFTANRPRGSARIHSWGMVLKRLCWRVSQG